MSGRNVRRITDVPPDTEEEKEKEIKMDKKKRTAVEEFVDREEREAKKAKQTVVNMVKDAEKSAQKSVEEVPAFSPNESTTSVSDLMKRGEQIRKEKDKAALENLASGRTPASVGETMSTGTALLDQMNVSGGPADLVKTGAQKEKQEEQEAAKRHAAGKQQTTVKDTMDLGAKITKERTPSSIEETMKKGQEIVKKNQEADKLRGVTSGGGPADIVRKGKGTVPDTNVGTGGSQFPSTIADLYAKGKELTTKPAPKPPPKPESTRIRKPLDTGGEEETGGEADPQVPEKPVPGPLRPPASADTGGEEEIPVPDPQVPEEPVPGPLRPGGGGGGGGGGGVGGGLRGQAGPDPYVVDSNIKEYMQFIDAGEIEEYFSGDGTIRDRTARENRSNAHLMLNYLNHSKGVRS
jgi:hypothetical protein